MKTKSMLTVATAFLLMVGCANDDIHSGNLFLKQIAIKDCSTDEFEYESGHLISYKSSFGERLSTQKLFRYENGRLKSVADKEGPGTCELRYGDNGLIEEELSCSSLGNDTQCKTIKYYEYDEKGRLKVMKYGFNDPNVIPMEIEFIWQNDNIIREDEYVNYVSERRYVGSRTFRYDNKRNFTNHDVAFLYVPSIRMETVLSKNNLISETESYSGGTIDRGSYIFTYNNRGYPVAYTYKVDLRTLSFTEMKYQ